jgi:hypothetical protein
MNVLFKLLVNYLTFRNIHMAQDRDRWRAFANTVMNLLGPQKAGNFLTSRAHC